MARYITTKDNAKELLFARLVSICNKVGATNIKHGVMMHMVVQQDTQTGGNYEL